MLCYLYACSKFSVYAITEVLLNIIRYEVVKYLTAVLYAQLFAIIVFLV